MTKEQLGALKAELKAELIQELWGQRTEKPWGEVRKDIEKSLQGFDNPHRYRIMSAIGTIIRYTLDVKSVTLLSADQVPRAREIATQLIGILQQEAPH